MSWSDRHRYRIEYSKSSSMRFTGHLDVLRAWERTLRRAGLMMAFTQGFNPRPRINLVAALPLGFTSQCELMDIQLLEKLSESQLRKRLSEVTPPGLEVNRISQIEHDAPKLQKLVQAAEYEVQFGSPPSNGDLTEKIDKLLHSTTIPRTRRGKSYDLRPLILTLEVAAAEIDSLLHMRLMTKDGATGRPEEVLLALGIDPASARIHRKNLILN